VALPVTQYAKSGDVNIAYQVVGDGPFDVVLSPPSVTHVELAWEWDRYAGCCGASPISAPASPSRTAAGRS
jgi:hypothetical protein